MAETGLYNVSVAFQLLNALSHEEREAVLQNREQSAAKRHPIFLGLLFTAQTKLLRGNAAVPRKYALAGKFRRVKGYLISS